MKEFINQDNPGDVYNRRIISAYTPRSSVRAIVEKTGLTRIRAEEKLISATVDMELDSQLFLTDIEGEWCIHQTLACEEITAPDIPLEPAKLFLPSGKEI